MQQSELITIRDLVTRLQPLASLGLQPEHRVFTDLREGHLEAVAQYPKHQHARTVIPHTYWKRLSFDDFSGRPTRSGEKGDILVPVRCNADEVRSVLTIALKAVKDSDFSPIDEQLRATFDDKGWNDDAQSRKHVGAYCTRLLVKLEEDLSEGVLTTAKVLRDSAKGYVHSVKVEFASDEPPPGRKSAGRPRSAHWDNIYAEAIRRLAREKKLQDGNISQFAKELHDWAKKNCRDSSPGKPQTPPSPETIAKRLGEILNGGSL